MTTFTKEQMLEIAKKVYPELADKWQIDERGVFYIISMDGFRNPFWRKFDPSLTGTETQKAQALDVIVAAFNLCHETAVNFHYFGSEKVYLFRVYENGCIKLRTDAAPDILTAAMMALVCG